MLGYPLTFSNLTMDEWIGFCLGLMFAVVVNAEAQAFVSTALGDVREGAKDRLHFNPVFHLSVTGTLAFFVAGFGWPRMFDIDSSKFKRPKLYTLISRFAGPAANLLFASILSSISILTDQILSVDPKLFDMVLHVNLAVGIFHLLPVPPLAGSSIIWVFIPERLKSLKWKVWKVSPFFLFALLVGARLIHTGIIQGIYDLSVNPLFRFFIDKSLVIQK